jgi:hypothetical protein
MSYSALVNGTTHLIVQGSNEAGALYDAIYHVSRNGEDVQVANGRGETVWFVEADTKVDDLDPTFPVIVHDRAA